MKQAGTTTIYANVVNLKTTPRELVFEFGAHFPDRPGQGPPSDFQPDVRVVLPTGMLAGIIKGLTQAVGQQQTASPRQPPGFQGAPSGPPKEGKS